MHAPLMLALAFLSAPPHAQTCKGSVCPIHGAAVVPLHAQTQAAKIKLQLHSGELRVIGDSPDLLELHFDPTTESPAPTIEERIEGMGVKLSVEGESPINRWEVGLSSRIRGQINIEASAAWINVNLSSTFFEQMAIESVGGTTALKLSGNQRYLKEVSVEQQTGPIQLDLLGSYPKLKEVSLESTVGPILVRASGDFDELESLKLQAATGDLTVEMEGSSLGRSAEIELSSNTGTISITVPRRMSVRAKVRATTGQVSAPGYSAESDKKHQLYSYDPEVGSIGRVYLTIESHTGNVDLRIGE